MFAEGYTLQQGDDMFYHEALHTRINTLYNKDNIVTEDNSQEKKALPKKTQARRSINEALLHKVPTLKVNKVNVNKDKDDNGDDDYDRKQVDRESRRAINIEKRHAGNP